ncbi:uncharacterized protein LOC143875896 isoform X2 [Tasmannia lanceolata]|uniref:uncharacterized protein LOC143875896 isoform X2 n=1 Tax=Tasmannia lanceolata TaxID=3420 RepID=UPI0040644A25
MTQKVASRGGNEKYGLPAFRFKNLSAIYDSEGSSNIGSSSKFQWKENGIESASSGRGRMEIDMLSPIGGRALRRSSRTRVASNGGGAIDDSDRGYTRNCDIDKQNCDPVDSSVHEMTLKELKDIWKGKKRKVQKSLDYTNPDGQRHPHLDEVHVKKEEPDLDEPLICWKSKLSKKSKFERKRLRKPTCSSSPDSAGSIEVSPKQEGTPLSSAVLDVPAMGMTNAPIIHGDLPQNTWDPCRITNIKSEIVETDYWECQNTVSVTDCSTNVCSVRMNLAGDLSTQSPKSIDEGELEIGCSVSFSAKMDLPQDSSAELPERVDEEVVETGESILPTEKFPHCYLNAMSTEFQQPGESSFLSGSAEEVCGIVKMASSLEMTSHESPPSSISDLKMVGVLNPPLSADSPGVISVAKDLGSKIVESCESDSSPQRMLCQTHSSSFSQSLYMDIDHDIGSMLTNEGNDGCNSDSKCDFDGKLTNKELLEGEIPTDIDKEDTLPDHEDHSTSDTNALYTSAQNLQPCIVGPDNFLSFYYNCPVTEGILPLAMLEQIVSDTNKEDTLPDHEDHSTSDTNALYTPAQNLQPCIVGPDNFHSFYDNCPVTEEILPHAMPEQVVSATVDEATHYFVNFSSNGPEVLTAMDELESYHGSKLEHPPKKLFLARKAISPTSQEKLRQAVDAEELFDNLHLSRAGPEEGEGHEVMMSPVKIKKKSKNNKHGCLPSVNKSILKSSHLSCTSSCACTDCSFVHMHAQKAIAFSQRQMHDIECLAMKLVKGLKSMKVVMDETILSEASPSTSSKFTPDEIRKTAETATELEETTRKWLSMMSRDCNRFCKIMKSTETKVATVSTTPKERKKLMFADEAGGTLCHVKVFEENPSHVISENVKADWKL